MEHAHPVETYRQTRDDLELVGTGFVRIASDTTMRAVSDCG